MKNLIKPIKIKPKKILLEYMDDNLNFEYDELLTDLTYLIEKKNPDGYWFAEVENFGWMSQTGYRFIKALDGRSLLENVLPSTDCHFRIYSYRKGIAIQNFHHDSPSGKEWYFLKPITEKVYSQG